MKNLVVLFLAVLSVSAFSDTNIKFEGMIDNSIDLEVNVLYRATKKRPGCGHMDFSPPEGFYWENKTKEKTFKAKRDSSGNYTIDFNIKNKKSGFCGWKADFFSLVVSDNTLVQDELQKYDLGMHGSFFGIEDITFLKCSNDKSNNLNCEHDFSTTNIYGNKYSSWDLAEFDYSNHEDRLFHLDIIKE